MLLKDFMEKELDHNILSKNSNNHERRKYIRNLLDDEELLRDIFDRHHYNIYSLNVEILIPKIGRSVYIINELCEKYQIKVSSKYDEKKIKRTIEKSYKTNIEKYGGSGNLLSRGSSLFDKRNKTVKEKYGVDNVFQIPEVVDKIKTTVLYKYGVHNVGLLNRSVKNNFSKPHRKVSAYLKSMGINHKNESHISDFYQYNDVLNKFYCPYPDIALQDEKIVIEIYGDFWHCNPEIFKPDDIISSKNRYSDYKYAKEVWEFDQVRQEHIEKCGYRVLVLWESEIKNETYKGKVNEFLGL